MAHISFRRTLIDAYRFPLAAIMAAPLGLVTYVVLSALAAWGFGQLALSTGIGEFRALIVFVPLAAVWAIWQGQLARVGTDEACQLPRIGKAESAVFLSMLGFMPILALTAILAFATAGFFAGSVLTALEVNPEELDLAGEGLSVTLDRLGQAGTAAVVLTMIAAAMAPLLLILRTCAFRPLAVERGRFVVFEPGGWTRGQSVVLLGAGLATLGPPVFAVLSVLVAIRPDGSLVQMFGVFALFSFPSLLFFGFCRSVLAQSRAMEAPATPQPAG